MESDLDQRLSAWMKRSQDGDLDAYQALLSEVTPLLRSFVQNQLHRAEWVDDVVQEALISMHRNRHTYDPSRAFRPWMYAIARHRLIDWVRKRRRLVAREQLGGSEPEDFRRVVDPVTEATGYEGLHRALALLSATQRDVIQRLKWDGFSVREIAASTGMTESSVKINAHRGYKLLRRLLGSGSDED